MTRSSVAQKCQEHITNALAKGARLVVGSPVTQGNFVVPTVLSDVTDDMAIAYEETFGPVAAILPFDTEAEVLTRANNTEYGLAAYVYTNDLRKALRLSDSLEYGMVALNTPKFTGAPIPFGDGNSLVWAVKVPSMDCPSTWKSNTSVSAACNF